jgi:hypothetical protein
MREIAVWNSFLECHNPRCSGKLRERFLGKSRPGIEQGFQDFHSLVRLDEFLRVKILRLEARI